MFKAWSRLDHHLLLLLFWLLFLLSFRVQNAVIIIILSSSISIFNLQWYINYVRTVTSKLHAECKKRKSTRTHARTHTAIHAKNIF
jgi:hypothetical protein